MSPGMDPDSLRNRAVSPVTSLNMQAFPNGHVVSGSIEQIETHIVNGRREDEVPPSDDDIGPPRSSLDHRDREIPQSRSYTPDVATRGKSPTPAITNPVNRSMSPAQAQNSTLTNIPLSRVGLQGRSPSPIVDRSNAPSDAFYPQKTVNGSVSGHNHMGSSGSVAADAMQSMKTELETLRQNNNWMKSSLLRASREGFLVSEGILDEDGIEDGASQGQLQSLVQLKNSRALLKVCLQIVMVIYL
jgi:hypothetical protein